MLLVAVEGILWKVWEIKIYWNNDSFKILNDRNIGSKLCNDITITFVNWELNQNLQNCWIFFLLYFAI